MKKMHLIGNGPSIKYFDNTEGIRIGCNFSDAKYNCEWTMIADIKPIKKLYEGTNLPCPAVITERAANFGKNKAVKLPPQRMTVHRVVPFIHWPDVHHKWGMNSAQHAVVYALEEFDVDEINLWGCDSLWSSDITSTTDQIVHKDLEFMNKTNVYFAWRDYWNKIISDNNNITFKIHGPEKPDLKEQPNLEWVKV